MRLFLDVLARNRLFSIAMSRITPIHEPLIAAIESIESIEWCDPLYSKVRVAISDDCSEGHFNEKLDSEGNYLLIYSIAPPDSDEKLSAIVYEILHDATLKCQFSAPDQEKVDAAFSKYPLEKLLGIVND